jgi:uncharacterized membrane protein
MMYLGVVLQLTVLFFAPYACRRFSASTRYGDFLSPVVLCYALGMLIKNLQLFPLNGAICTAFSQGSILLALPLLLFSTDLRFAGRHARPFILSFILSVVASFISLGVLAYFFQPHLPNVWQAAGMLAGVYIGGTANMQAIGIALQASESSFVMLNAADILVGGSYLLLLTSVVHGLLRFVLKDFTDQDPNHPEQEAQSEAKSNSITQILQQLLSSIAIGGSAAGLTYLIFGNLNSTSFLILTLTTLSIVAARSPWIKKLGDTFHTGEYLLLIFCISLGMLADLGEIAGKGGVILLFSALTMYASIFIHLGLARLFGIDRDTFLITSTATIFGPPFIAQVASAMKNPKVIFPGIATALLGIAIGNYAGIGLAYFLRWFLG